MVSPESVAPEKIKRASLFGETLKCFSIYTNTKIMFGTKLGPDAIGPINGLRFLVMAWIIVVHTVLYMPDFMGETLIPSRHGSVKTLCAIVFTVKAEIATTVRRPEIKRKNFIRGGNHYVNVRITS